jgi:GABA(A) receptor-associated protein
MNFKKQHSLQERRDESLRVLEKYQDRVPIVCERSPTAAKDCPQIDKMKYMVPFDLSIGQFIWVIRKRMHLPPEKALFLFINGFIPTSSSIIGEVYESHKSDDLFLYITYSLENTFG